MFYQQRLWDHPHIIICTYYNIHEDCVHDILIDKYANFLYMCFMFYKSPNQLFVLTVLQMSFTNTNPFLLMIVTDRVILTPRSVFKTQVLLSVSFCCGPESSRQHCESFLGTGPRQGRYTGSYLKMSGFYSDWCEFLYTTRWITVELV